MDKNEIPSADYLFDNDNVPQNTIYYEKPNRLLTAVYWTRYILAKLFGFVAGLSAIILYFGGIAIHLWTIIIAFLNNGFLASFVTLCLPVISQIYWAWRSYIVTGTVWNSYISWLIIYVVSCLLVLLSSVFAVWLEE